MKTIEVKTCSGCMLLHTDENWNSSCKLDTTIKMPYNLNEFNMDKGIHEKCPLKKEAFQIKLKPAPKPNGFLFHAINPTFGIGEPLEFNEDNYKMVAEIVYEKPPITPFKDAMLEWIFKNTQNIDDSWTLNKGLTTEEKDIRSTSVGDIVIIAEAGEDFVYRCENIGWVYLKQEKCWGCHYIKFPTLDEHVHFAGNGCDCE